LEYLDPWSIVWIGINPDPGWRKILNRIQEKHPGNTINKHE